MKLNVLSDLHLSVCPMERPANDADLVVLAGDLGRPKDAAAWAMGFDKPVLFVLGNHEFYGGSIDGTPREMKRLCAGTHVHVLDQDEIVVGGVRFLGATLWTDFALYGEPDRRAAAIAEARRLMRDFSRVRLSESGDAVFSPDDSAALFTRQSRWLDDRLNDAHDGPTVVITHHAPSTRSIHPRFADSLLNPCFVSDAEHLLGEGRTPLWIHGHTHDSFDYRVQGTRVVCNSRGYAPSGAPENPGFDPHFIVEVPAAGRPGGIAARAAAPRN